MTATLSTGAGVFAVSVNSFTVSGDLGLGSDAVWGSSGAKKVTVLDGLPTACSRSIAFSLAVVARSAASRSAELTVNTSRGLYGRASCTAMIVYRMRDRRSAEGDMCAAIDVTTNLRRGTNRINLPEVSYKRVGMPVKDGLGRCWVEATAPALK
jgi:hypothetical protein